MNGIQAMVAGCCGGHPMLLPQYQVANCGPPMGWYPPIVFGARGESHVGQYADRPANTDKVTNLNNMIMTAIVEFNHIEHNQYPLFKQAYEALASNQRAYIEMVGGQLWNQGYKLAAKAMFVAAQNAS